jgi:hypothetical protein
LRLASAFRGDIHQANNAVAGDSDDRVGIFLRLRLPGQQTIEYRRQEGLVLRSLLKNGQIVSREEFAFPPGIELAIRNDDPRLIVLTINSRPGELPTDDGSSQPSAYAVPVNLHVETALNRAASFMAVMPAERRSP